MGKPDLIGTVEACEILGGIQKSTLIHRMAAGLIRPAMKMPGETGAYLFERSEVIRHRDELDAEKAQATA